MILRSPLEICTYRSESRLVEEPGPERSSPKTCQQRIIMERQMQLQREILEIHDTVTRGLRSTSQLASWDATSIASTWGSAAGSLSRAKLKKHHRAPVWDTVRGVSPLWDSVSCHSTFARVRSEDLAKNSRDSRPPLNKQSTADDKKIIESEKQLPSWELLEKTLDDKFSSTEYPKSSSFGENKDVNVEYVVISNDTKQILDKPTRL